MITVIISAIEKLIGRRLMSFFIALCLKRYTKNVLGILAAGIAYKLIETFYLSGNLDGIFSIIKAVLAD